MDSSTDDLLSHVTFNTSAPTTVLLIHGAFSSSREWDLVTPILSQHYHLLVPDVPGSGSSSHLPFSVLDATRLLAALIRHSAHSGIAHIIGFSLGSKSAIALATTYPELVDSVFVSGYGVFPPGSLSTALPYMVWATNRAENLIPRPFIRWLMDGTDVRRTDTNDCTLELCRAIVTPMTTYAWPKPWKASTLVMAAGKSGFLPTADHAEDAVRLADIGKQGNEDTTAVTHKEMRHPWNRQDPKLFAETARAWFEKRELPAGFERLHNE